MSLSSVLDQVSWLRPFWDWLRKPSDDWKRAEETLKRIPHAITAPTIKDVAITDCKSLFDLTTRTATPSCTEFRTQLQARAIKDLLSEGIRLRWVASGAQLADALTKQTEASFFKRETLQHGQYQLSDEQSTLKARASARDRIKWLKREVDPQSEGAEPVLFTIFSEIEKILGV